MFKLFFGNVEIIRKRIGANKPCLPRKRKAPSSLAMEFRAGDHYHPVSIEDHYRQIYYEALDLVTSSIEDRFNQPGYAVYQNLEELLIKAANKEDYSSELAAAVSFYGDDLDESELITQLQILGFSGVREDGSGSNKITLKEILTFLSNLSEGQRTFFKQVCSIARLILVVPATNASSERSFGTSKIESFDDTSHLQRESR